MKIKRQAGFRPRDKDQLINLIKGLEKDVVSPSDVGRHSGLTRRELQVVRLVADGHSNSEIAEILSISVNTVMRHMTNIFAKTNTTNRVEAALFAARNGLL